jgi:hypothetical protein
MYTVLREQLYKICLSSCLDDLKSSLPTVSDAILDTVLKHGCDSEKLRVHNCNLAIHG